MEAELRQFFFFHSEDVAAEQPPGSDRIVELHAVLRRLRGQPETEVGEQRRKAIAFLLAEYQCYLRDNPWA